MNFVAALRLVLQNYERVRRKCRRFSFLQVVRFCLQKNPKERPNCASLLNKKFFKRDLQPDAIRNELLTDVPVVGEGEAAVGRRELG